MIQFDVSDDHCILLAPFDSGVAGFQGRRSERRFSGIFDSPRKLCVKSAMQHSTKSRQQKTRSGLRTKTGQVMSALAEFIKRPQADTQIGAEGIVEELLGEVKGVCAGCADRVFSAHEWVF